MEKELKDKEKLREKVKEEILKVMNDHSLDFLVSFEDKVPLTPF